MKSETRLQAIKMLLESFSIQLTILISNCWRDQNNNYFNTVSTSRDVFLTLGDRVTIASPFGSPKTFFGTLALGPVVDDVDQLSCRRTDAWACRSHGHTVTHEGSTGIFLSSSMDWSPMWWCRLWSKTNSQYKGSNTIDGLLKPSQIYGSWGGPSADSQLPHHHYKPSSTSMVVQ